MCGSPAVVVRLGTPPPPLLPDAACASARALFGGPAGATQDNTASGATAAIQSVTCTGLSAPRGKTSCSCCLPSLWCWLFFPESVLVGRLWVDKVVEEPREDQKNSSEVPQPSARINRATRDRSISARDVLVKMKLP